MDNLYGLFLPSRQAQVHSPSCALPSIDVDASILIIPHTRLTTFRHFFVSYILVPSPTSRHPLVPRFPVIILVLLSLSNRVSICSPCYRYVRAPPFPLYHSHKLSRRRILFRRFICFYYPLYRYRPTLCALQPITPQLPSSIGTLQLERSEFTGSTHAHDLRKPFSTQRHCPF